MVKKSKSEPSSEDKQIVIVNNIEPPLPPEDIRTISLYGDISEKMCGEAVSALVYLGETATSYQYEDPDDPDSKITKVVKPLNMIVSTQGGSAAEMFAVYDTMRSVKLKCEIGTFGVGKVMSAGVLLLAAGTKGKRKIGANCRVMIHGVAGGLGGSLSNMENEIAEVRWIQERYIECLAETTKLTKRKIKGLLKKQIDVYLSAEEAVKFGIADEIV